MGIIGIDIGRFSIKTALIEPTSKGFTLVSCQVFPLNQKENSDNRLETIEILRQLASQNDPLKTKYVVGLEADKVNLRKKPFPFKERHKILKSLAFELEDEIPTAHEDLLYDGKIIRFVGATSEVLAMAAKKSYVEDLLSMLRDGHIEPQIVSLSNAAISNLFESTFEAPPSTTPTEQPTPQMHNGFCVLDIGYKNTKASFFLDNRLIEVRIIDWGTIDLVNAVSKKYSLPASEAVKEVQRKGFVLLSDDGATKDQIVFSNLFKEKLDDLSQKLKSTFIETETTHQMTVDSIDFIGGISFFRNLAPYLTQKLNVKTNRLRLVPIQKWVPDQINLETNPQQEFQCAVAISLAIEALKRPINPAINFLNGDLAKKTKALKLVFEKWGHTLQVAGALVAGFFIWAFLRDDLSASMLIKADEALNTVVQATPEIKGRRATVATVNKYINDQLKIRKNIEAAEDLKGINSAIDVISSISNSLPKKQDLKINVITLQVNNDTVTFEGEVDMASNIQKIRDSLKSVSTDGKINENRGARAMTPGWNGFSFNFKVQRKLGG